MAALKYSRQRESIKHFLAETKEHPTADTVYLHVKKQFPNISLGTVYRNLKRSKFQHPMAGTDLMDVSNRTIISCVQSADGYWIWISI